jgi:hypothetical protein
VTARIRPADRHQAGVTATYNYGPDGERVKNVVTQGASQTSYYLGGDVENSPAGLPTNYPHADAREIVRSVLSVTAQRLPLLQRAVESCRKDRASSAALGLKRINAF